MKNNNNIYISVIVISSLLSSTAYGAVDRTKGVGKLFDTLGDLANMSIGILVTLALATFFWGLVKYVFKLGGSKTPDNGRSLMIYGIVALFVMVSIWGITSFIGDFLGIKDNAAAPIPSTLLP